MSAAIEGGPRHGSATRNAEPCACIGFAAPARSAAADRHRAGPGGPGRYRRDARSRRIAGGACRPPRRSQGAARRGPSSRRLHPRGRYRRRLRSPHIAESRGPGHRHFLPRIAVGPASSGLWRHRAGDAGRRYRDPSRGQPGAIQTARPVRDASLSRERRVARQGRRLCHPGPRRRAGAVDLGLVFERRRPAVDETAQLLAGHGYLARCGANC